MALPRKTVLNATLATATALAAPVAVQAQVPDEQPLTVGIRAGQRAITLDCAEVVSHPGPEDQEVVFGGDVGNVLLSPVEGEDDGRVNVVVVTPEGRYDTGLQVPADQIDTVKVAEDLETVCADVVRAGWQCAVDLNGEDPRITRTFGVPFLTDQIHSQGSGWTAFSIFQNTRFAKMTFTPDEREVFPAVNVETANEVVIPPDVLTHPQIIGNEVLATNDVGLVSADISEHGWAGLADPANWSQWAIVQNNLGSPLRPATLLVGQDNRLNFTLEDGRVVACELGFPEPIEPGPEPEPEGMEPEPAPQPEPMPEPQPAPQPEGEPEAPEPEPAPQPEPNPEAEPEGEPEASEPEPQPAPEPEMNEPEPNPNPALPIVPNENPGELVQVDTENMRRGPVVMKIPNLIQPPVPPNFELPVMTAEEAQDLVNCQAVAALGGGNNVIVNDTPDECLMEVCPDANGDGTVEINIEGRSDLETCIVSGEKGGRPFEYTGHAGPLNHGEFVKMSGDANVGGGVASLVKFGPGNDGTAVAFDKDNANVGLDLREGHMLGIRGSAGMVEIRDNQNLGRHKVVNVFKGDGAVVDNNKGGEVMKTVNAGDTAVIRWGDVSVADTEAEALELAERLKASQEASQGCAQQPGEVVNDVRGLFALAPLGLLALRRRREDEPKV